MPRVMWSTAGPACNACKRVWTLTRRWNLLPTPACMQIRVRVCAGLAHTTAIVIVAVHLTRCYGGARSRFEVLGSARTLVQLQVRSVQQRWCVIQFSLHVYIIFNRCIAVTTTSSSSSSILLMSRSLSQVAVAAMCAIIPLLELNGRLGEAAIDPQAGPAPHEYAGEQTHRPALQHAHGHTPYTTTSHALLLATPLSFYRYSSSHSSWHNVTL